MREAAVRRFSAPGAGQRAREWGYELRRRTALARQPQPDGIATPALRLLLGEFGTFVETWRARRAEQAAAIEAAAVAASRPVMLLPGFGTKPWRMRRLQRGLEDAGHRVFDWGLGWNLGARPDLLGRLGQSIERAAEREGEPIALVGWSLGGLFAREAAKLHPHAVSLVVTMGSPFSGDLHANRAWRAYHCLTGQDVSYPPVEGELAAKPPVPTIALWSPRDGIVHPRAARGRPGERDAAIALRCTHLGFASHPAVLAEVRRQLESEAGPLPLVLTEEAGEGFA